MSHFATQLKPDNNNSLLRVREDDKWLRSAFEKVLEALANGNYGGPFSTAEELVSEYRVMPGMHWMFSGHPELFRRLEWRFLAEGWNAAKVVNVPGQGVCFRLFSFVEEIVVHVLDGEPFHLTFTPPDGLGDLSQPDIEALIAGVVKSGGWRYSADSREYVPPSQIASVRHLLAREPTEDSVERTGS